MRTSNSIKRDRLFWFCFGFGIVISIYFLFQYFFQSSEDLEHFQKYKYKSAYSFYAPDYLIPADSISDKADFQFTDFLKETFLIVVQENITSLEKTGINPSIFEYATYVQETIIQSLENSRIISFKENEINKLQSITCELIGKYSDQSVYYIFTVYQFEDYFYQMICWSSTSVKVEIKKDIYLSMQSFEVN